jgi:CheY-like chemotaxis protein
MPLDAAQQARALEVIDRNIGAQTQLVEDLLDISRIVSGRMRLTVQPLDLEEVIRSATESLRPAADARRIELETTLDPGVGPVLGDPDRMQQVVWNLLSNAIKFTPPGGRVHVQLRRAGAFMELVVTDTGSGIEPGFLPHVFERFRQGDGTTTRPIGGLGLGLAIVRHLVELHGGVVEAASPGTDMGAVFTVRLPLMLEQRPSADAGHERVSAQLGTLSMARRLDGVRVLSVDSDEASAELLSLVLRAAGAEVQTASGTAAALAEAERWHPQIIVADLEMPGDDGYSLVQKLQASAGPGPRPLAIAVTAYARREDRLRALAAGFQSHVPKPVDPAEIVAAVANLLGRAGADSIS